MHQGLQPRALRVHTVTFNMAKQNPQELPEQLLGRAGCPAGLKKYDVVVVGTQESGNLQVILKYSPHWLCVWHMTLGQSCLNQVCHPPTHDINQL